MIIKNYKGFELEAFRAKTIFGGGEGIWYYVNRNSDGYLVCEGSYEAKEGVNVRSVIRELKADIDSGADYLFEGLNKKNDG